MCMYKHEYILDVHVKLYFIYTHDRVFTVQFF